MQIVINRCFGGFGLSDAAKDEIKKQKKIDELDEYTISRDDADLVRVVLELGEQAYGDYADLRVVTIPDDVEYEIDEYDGMESIHEKHRVWC